MKDFTVYSRYETFLKQQDSSITIDANFNCSINFLQKLFKDITIKEYNKAALIANYKGYWLVFYAPIIDQYKKQYTIYVAILNGINDECLYTETYKDTTQPNQMTNSVVLDVLKIAESIKNEKNA
jgi:hypothetical protein